MSDSYSAASTSYEIFHIPELECAELKPLHTRINNFANTVSKVIEEQAVNLMEVGLVEEKKAITLKAADLKEIMGEFFLIMEDMNSELMQATNRPKVVEEMLSLHEELITILRAARNTNPEGSTQDEAKEIDFLSDVYESTEQEYWKNLQELSEVDKQAEDEAEIEESERAPYVIQVKPQGSSSLSFWNMYYKNVTAGFNNMPADFILTRFKTTLEAVTKANLADAKAIDVKAAASSSNSSSGCHCVVQ